ncbi:MAG: aldehyde dehydrogenase family protein [Akkermansiaceae bacterium]|nr:aldehyde dehydrogenase family protein [Verrucomicrobiales bacterium]
MSQFQHFPSDLSGPAALDFAALARSGLESLRLAQLRWARTTLTERLKCVRNLRQLIAGNAMALAEASAMSRSRPVTEALTAEVMPLVEACRFLERDAAKLLRPRRLGRRGLPLWLSGVQSEIHREAYGAVLIIGPGNYPLFLPGVQLIQALVAGNAVLLKPGEGGSPAARVLIDLIVRAGFDAQLVALLAESIPAAQAAMAAGPDKVIFTGSASVGENILRQLAPRLIPSTMELSGCDAVIVRADADLELTVKALVFGLTLNNGATCIAPKRVFVPVSIASELEKLLSIAILTAFAKPSSRLLRREASDRCRTLVADALAQQARVIIGEIQSDGSIALPLVLGGVSPKARLLDADLFEPVLAIIPVQDDNEAVLWANDSRFALGASIFSRDEMAARAIAVELNAGVVSINDLIIPTADPRLPFGGRNRSGSGVTRGAEGLLELTRPKVVTFTRGRFRPAFEPARPGDETVFTSYLKWMHGRGLKSRCLALATLLRAVLRRQRLT